MKRVLVSLLALGLIMASQTHSANDLPDFDKLWNYNDPVETRAKFNEVLPKAEASGDIEYTNQLLTQIARTYSLVGEYDSAHAILDRVEPNLAAEPTVATVRYLLERGRTYRSSGDPAAAEPLFEKAYRIGRELNAEYLTIDAAHMVAIAAADQQEREKWTKIGIALADSASDRRARYWKGPLTNNLGWTYFDAGEYNKALEYFQQAYGAFKENGKPEQVDIAEWTIARCLRALGRDEEALATQLELLEKYQQEGKEDGYVYEELAELYLKRGAKDQAKPYFAKAFELLKSDNWLMENEPERMERMRNLGGVK